MVVDLKESREKIDRIDKEITRLFEERMEVANDVAAYKRSTGKRSMIRKESSRSWKHCAAMPARNLMRQL